MMLATFFYFIFLLMFCCRRPGRGSFSPPGNSVDQPVPHPHCGLLFLPQTLQPAAGHFLSPQQGLALCAFDTFSKQNEASLMGGGRYCFIYHNSFLCTSLFTAFIFQPSETVSVSNFFKQQNSWSIKKDMSYLFVCCLFVFFL